MTERVVIHDHPCHLIIYYVNEKGEKDGVYRHYHDPNPTKKVEELPLLIEDNYVNGIKHGIQKDWFGGPGSFSNFEFINGKVFEGHRIRYHSNGIIEQELIVENGKIVLDRKYDQNGNLLN